MKLLQNLQPAVKKETKRVALIDLIGAVILVIVFGVFHLIIPEQVPFNYTVILGAIVGAFIATLNFLLMGVSVQAVAGAPDDDTARTLMKTSYRNRLLLQLLWIVLAMVLPCFQPAAGIAPLLFPSLGIKVLGMLGIYGEK